MHSFISFYEAAVVTLKGKGVRWEENPAQTKQIDRENKDAAGNKAPESYTNKRTQDVKLELET